MKQNIDDEKLKEACMYVLTSKASDQSFDNAFNAGFLEAIDLISAKYPEVQKYVSDYTERR